jgi:hypothetical protein
MTGNFRAKGRRDYHNAVGIAFAVSLNASFHLHLYRRHPLLRPPPAKNRVNGCHNELGSTVRNQFQAVNCMKRQHQLSQLGVIS